MNSALTPTTPAEVASAQTEALVKMPQLDGLRALAVGAVMVEHFGKFSWTHAVPLSASGVQLFFVLSGFLITAILLRCRDDADNAGNHGTVLRQFYIRRFLRIFPLYYLVVIVGIIVGIPGMRDPALWHLTYTSNFYFAKQGHFEGFTGHFWSLSVEEQYYLVWPWLMLFLPKRALLPTIVAITLIGPAFRAIGYFAGMSQLAIYILPFAALDAFGLGGLLAYFMQRKEENRRETLSRAGLWIGLPLLVVILIAERQFGMQGLSDIGLKTGMALFFTWVISRAARGFKGPAKYVLESPPLQYLGKISYGLYVYHVLMWFLPSMKGGMFFKMFPVMKTWNITWIFVLGAISIIVASLSWHLFERPINDLKRFFPYSRRVSRDPVSITST